MYKYHHVPNGFKFAHINNPPNSEVWVIERFLFSKDEINQQTSKLTSTLHWEHTGYQHRLDPYKLNPGYYKCI